MISGSSSFSGSCRVHVEAMLAKRERISGAENEGQLLRTGVNRKEEICKEGNWILKVFQLKYQLLERNNHAQQETPYRSQEGL